MENKIRAVIFDLGNVLIGFDHTIAVGRISGYAAKSAQEIYALFFDSEITREFERGDISAQEFFEKIKAVLNLKISFPEFLPIWNEIFFSRPDAEEFVRSLEPRIKLVLLSNINELHYDYVKEKFSSAIALFNEVIPSYVTGFMKPAREIYALAIRATGETIENIVYVDDRQDLIEAARSYGLQSIQFKDVEQLRKEFQKLGIIKEDAIFQTK